MNKKYLKILLFLTGITEKCVVYKNVKNVNFSYYTKKPLENLTFSRGHATCVRRFELPTPWSVAKCSIQLSYTHILSVPHGTFIILLQIPPFVNRFLKIILEIW